MSSACVYKYKTRRLKYLITLFACALILQILTSVKEITLVTQMPHAQTPKDRIFVLVTPDIREMEAIAQVFDAFLL